MILEGMSRKTGVYLRGKAKADLEAAGYLVEVVEHVNQYRTKDLFGAFDLLGIGGGKVVFVQVTTKDNLLAHKKKIMSLPCYSRIRNIPNALILCYAFYRFEDDRRWYVEKSTI